MRAIAHNLSEMLKGVLEGIILEIIHQREVYGYEIVRILTDMGFEGIVEGTVYTVLLRVEKNGFVKTVKKPSEVGPPRKFYYLSDRGEEELEMFWQRWQFLSTQVEKLMERRTGE